MGNGKVSSALFKTLPVRHNVGRIPGIMEPGATSTEPEVIRKVSVKANMENYEETYRHFDWSDATNGLPLYRNGKANIAFDAIDVHVGTPRKNRVALIWEGENGRREKYTFLDAHIISNKIASMLRNLGVVKGDRVFVFLPRIPELYFSIIGIAKTGAIAGPMFSAFGPDGVRDRLVDSSAKVLITTPELYERVKQVKRDLHSLEYTIIVGASEPLNDGEVSFEQEMEHASEKFEPEMMDLEDPLYILYTSGTTGKPKGIVHVHRDMLAHYLTTKWVLDLREDDVYWCTADPGWVTGMVYGIYGPWLNGITQVVCEGRFDAGKWYEMIDKYKVSVWYTAPTSLRLLMKAGEDLIAQHALDSLRLIYSVGEPLNPEVIRWGLKVYGLPIHDNWWQTETGAQMIANYPCLPIKVGSMGRPFPGVEAAIVDAEGRELPANMTGFLALRPGWPSMLRSVWGNKERFDEYFKINGWYATGDTAYKDADGYFWFVGRADDVINTSGHRVGPFEVESALVEHDAVAEAGVIGKPDAERGEIIKAFVTLRQGYEPSDELKAELQKHVRETLAAHAYPKEIEFRESLPKTRSGKIMRRVLKAIEMGVPTGDLSGLED